VQRVPVSELHQRQRVEPQKTAASRSPTRAQCLYAALSAATHFSLLRPRIWNRVLSIKIPIAWNRLYLSSCYSLERQFRALRRREPWFSLSPDGLPIVVRRVGPSSFIGGGVGVKSIRFRVRFSTKSSRRRWRRHHLEIRSFYAFPRLVGALLRCQRQVHEGGVRLRRLMYRSLRSIRFIALKVVGSAERSVKDTPAVVGVAVGWRVVRAQSSHGVSRRRASIHRRRGSGRVPGRCSSIVVFIPASGVGCLLRLSQSFLAMRLLQI
jgi:hypothetical protein